jgi:cystine transport system substrate-binding protein
MSKTIKSIAAVAATVGLLGAGAIATPAVAATKTITIATEGTYAPFSYVENGKLVGYDVEVATVVAKKAGYKIKWQKTTWDGIFAGLEAKRWDAIANQVTIRADRKAKYDLSEPYTSSSYAVITRKDDTRVTKVEDIKGLTAVGSATSSFTDLAKQYGAKVEVVEDNAGRFGLLQAKRVDVIVNDSLWALDYIKNNRDANVKIAATFGDASLQGFAFRKDSGYVKKFNAALASLIKNGTIKKIGVKYFGKDVTK